MDNFSDLEMVSTARCHAADSASFSTSLYSGMQNPCPLVAIWPRNSPLKSLLVPMPNTSTRRVEHEPSIFRVFLPISTALCSPWKGQPSVNRYRRSTEKGKLPLFIAEMPLDRPSSMFVPSRWSRVSIACKNSFFSFSPMLRRGSSTRASDANATSPALSLGVMTDTTKCRNFLTTCRREHSCGCPSETPFLESMGLPMLRLTSTTNISARRGRARSGGGSTLPSLITRFNHSLPCK
mmetsp:Transcript_14163/g.36146  ORF Transcript_14163/g.36146 Transcript_14163/m.36146 type:complete len:237 (+) Transcript_14163:844-1554(+)